MGEDVGLTLAAFRLTDRFSKEFSRSGTSTALWVNFLLHRISLRSFDIFACLFLYVFFSTCCRAFILVFQVLIDKTWFSSHIPANLGVARSFLTTLIFSKKSGCLHHINQLWSLVSWRGSYMGKIFQMPSLQTNLPLLQLILYFFLQYMLNPPFEKTALL